MRTRQPGHRTTTGAVPVPPPAEEGRAVRSRTRWSSAGAGASDAFDFWADVVCDTFVGVAVRAGGGDTFEARIETSDVDGVGFAALTASPQRVVRTGRLIARDHEDVVLANIQLDGRARLEQNGRVAVLSEGAMAFVDSAHPYELDFAGDFSQLVVKVPRNCLPHRSLSRATAVELDSSTPGRVVADFLVGLHRLEGRDPVAALALLPHALDLLDTALGWAADGALPRSSATAFTRERVHRFVRRHALDHGLDAAAVAAGCGVSRRTLYRALAEDGETLTGLIRRVRVSHVQRMVRAHPDRPLAAVADACGFGGEAQMYRAFRAVTGTTPGAYRSG
ncbi:helix-turn-helix domain-containing protein [Streptomyces violaceorubidus]|uniref:AraC-like ligand-binding domain-containing protein n=1 Tax=Streptomyces violaceorubidus TaxID=284042 RepID=UPI0009978B01|nr:helix-turn-helix domain-containing protein [Streptomyces violaceorubidus]